MILTPLPVRVFSSLLLLGVLLAACSASDVSVDSVDVEDDDEDMPKKERVDGGAFGTGTEVPANANGVKDGQETDVDCGGPGEDVARCADGKACLEASDCSSVYCSKAGLCSTPSAEDGEMNGDETDVDCGGAIAPKCEPGKQCLVDGDCAESVCGRLVPNVCDVPTYDDGVRNGNESDVDCGGDPDHPCDVGKSCTEHSDCVSNGCGYGKTCTPRPSCTLKDGGDTCRKEDGTTESCCTSIDIPLSSHAGPAFKIDKYMATSGRMRAFLERVNGDVRGYITTNKPPWWRDEWTPWLPASFNGRENNNYANPVIPTVIKGWGSGKFTRKLDSKGKETPELAAVIGDAEDITLNHVHVASTWAQVAGGVIFDQGSQGCYLGSGSYGHPTYVVPKTDAIALFGDGYDRWISQEALDQRPINCTNWPVLAALCAFDGGKPLNEKQYAFVYDDDGDLSGGRSTYPWGSPPAMSCVDKVCTPAAGYDKVNNPHVGGYAYIDPPDVPGTEKFWTPVGPGTVSFSTNVCRDCVSGWVNWSFSYQDPLWNPYSAAHSADEQARRARDQSYFISVPGAHPKGASRPFDGERVQDIAGLMYEATLRSTASYPATTQAYISFGTDDLSDDIVALVPTVTAHGGSFEGHIVGVSTTYRLPTKYGKMSVRCVY